MLCVSIISSSEVRYIPASLPGMGFRRTAALWRQNLLDMAELPYHFTQSQIVSYCISNSDILLELGFTEGRHSSTIICVKIA